MVESREEKKNLPAMERRGPQMRNKAANKIVRKIPKISGKAEETRMGGRIGSKNREEASSRQFLFRKLPTITGRLEELPLSIRSYETLTKA